MLYVVYFEQYILVSEEGSLVHVKDDFLFP